MAPPLLFFEQLGAKKIQGTVIPLSNMIFCGYRHIGILCLDHFTQYWPRNTSFYGLLQFAKFCLDSQMCSSNTLWKLTAGENPAIHKILKKKNNNEIPSCPKCGQGPSRKPPNLFQAYVWQMFPYARMYVLYFCHMFLCEQISSPTIPSPTCRHRGGTPRDQKHSGKPFLIEQGRHEPSRPTCLTYLSLT